MKSSVGTKIGLGYALAVIALMVIGITAHQNITKLNENIGWVEHTYLVKGNLDKLLTLLAEAETAGRGFALTGQDRYLETYQTAVREGGDIDQVVKILKDKTADNTVQQERINRSETGLLALVARKKAEMQETIGARRSKGVGEVQRILTSRNQVTLVELRKLIDEMQGEEDGKLKVRTDDQAASVHSTKMTIVAGIPISIAVLAIVGMAITTHIARPLQAMSESAHKVRLGDLDVTVPGEGRADEVGVLGQAFNGMIESLRSTAKVAELVADGDLRVDVRPQSDNDILGKALSRMVGNLRTMLGDINRAANLLGTASRQLASSSIEMAAGSAETSTAVVETTATVGEVRQTAQIANQEAKTMAERARQAAQSAQAGREATDAAGEGMHRIREQMDSIATSMVRLSEQSQAIGDIIASVDDLTQQSNLLAVNAAIEAAKAGDRGKGFAVVAQEVKSLAEQSRNATTQVRSILSDIQRATSAAVMATEQGTKTVENGVQQFSEAGASIRTLTGTSNEASQSASQIALSSQEQLVGMEQVAQAMESIKQASQQNVDSAHQLEQSARDLADLGQRLQKTVERYSM